MEKKKIHIQTGYCHYNKRGKEGSKEYYKIGREGKIFGCEMNRADEEGKGGSHQKWGRKWWLKYTAINWQKQGQRGWTKRERKESELGFECKSLAKNPEAEEQKPKTNSKSSRDHTQKFQER